jgi:SOS-response transcriptional repressor LexA
LSNYGNQVILEMARFLRENPSATVNQLAEHMGWAENRSVYYWLNQAGFKGIRDFRKVALDRSFSFSNEDIIREDLEKTYLPIVEQINSPKHYEYAKEDFLCLIKTSTTSFVYRVSNHDWAPFLIPGDLLVVDPEVKPQNQDIFLVWVRGQGTLILKKLADNYFARDPYAFNVLKGSSHFNYIGCVVLLYRLRKNKTPKFE